MFGAVVQRSKVNSLLERRIRKIKHRSEENTENETWKDRMMDSTKREWVRVKGDMVNKSNTCLIRVQERKRRVEKYWKRSCLRNIQK